MSFDVVLRSILSAAFVGSVIRVATPILLPALGGLISELAGVTNVALEGLMLIAALVGVVISAFTGNAWLGCLIGVACSAVVAILLAYFHLNLKADIILSGLAINIASSGGTIFILYLLTKDKGSSSKLASLSLPRIAIPVLDGMPVLGPMLSRHNVLTYVAVLLVFLIWVFLYRTRLGIHIRAVGENAEAAGSVGINVRRTRYIALMLSGVMAGLGGINMSMGYLNMFQRDMTAGRGFIALAAVHLGNRRPLGVALASLFFGFADALSNQLGSLAIPPQWVQMIPYAATVLALVVYALQGRAAAVERARRLQERLQAHVEATGGE
ncbi:MAG: ABC transporter permease [Chloroflexi bacterium]|nr:ABC transporter permease [Chloroflexota bacterium]